MGKSAGGATRETGSPSGPLSWPKKSIAVSITWAGVNVGPRWLCSQKTVATAAEAATAAILAISRRRVTRCGCGETRSEESRSGEIGAGFARLSDWFSRLRCRLRIQAAQESFGQIGGHRHVGESRFDCHIGPSQPLESRAKLPILAQRGRQFGKLWIVQIAIASAYDSIASNISRLRCAA